MAASVLLLDDPLPGVRRLTLNRPEKRNALNNELRGAILTALKTADADPSVKVSILRGAGPSFSSGYDLSADNTVDQPFYSPGGPGQWARHVVDGWFTIWDLAKPVIAQVHGYCLAGGSELAACCDLVYVAEDARIGYPPTRLMSPPTISSTRGSWACAPPWRCSSPATRSAARTRPPRDSPTAPSPPPSWRRRCSESRSASHSCPPSSPRSTSAPSTARWRSWGCVRPSEPAPSSRRSRSPPRRARPTARSSSATAPACATC